ncbi:hypothetical protein QBC34DRAFT_492265 [Podospora aff. communis PSN243]|uniref:Uncharacterized protein n=1 Tax=Podospora aff. communis PSN243 TaxID=3040156 RepID=A0AAV9GWF7_9PEZI|nr:hypothetical protein QBC34DRAFT_492265 [Podospora aff. communis PSN243]
MNAAFHAVSSASTDKPNQGASHEDEESFPSVPIKKSRSPEPQIPSIPFPPESVSASMASEQTSDPSPAYGNPPPANEKPPSATRATSQPMHEGLSGLGGDLLELKAMRRTMRRLENNFKGYMSQMNDTDGRVVKSSPNLTDLASLRTQNEALLTDNTNLEKRNEEVENENERLKRDLEDFKKLKDDYTKLEVEKRGLESALEIQRDEIKGLKETIETQNNQQVAPPAIQKNDSTASSAHGQPPTPASTTGCVPPPMPPGMYGLPFGGWNYGHGVPQDRQQEMVQQQREGRDRMRDRGVDEEDAGN